MHLKFAIVRGLVEAVLSRELELNRESRVGSSDTLDLALVSDGESAQLAQDKVLMQTMVSVSRVHVVLFQVLSHTPGRFVSLRHPLGVNHLRYS